MKSRLTHQQLMNLPLSELKLRAASGKKAIQEALSKPENRAKIPAERLKALDQQYGTQAAA